MPGRWPNSTSPRGQTMVSLSMQGHSSPSTERSSLNASVLRAQSSSTAGWMPTPCTALYLYTLLSSHLTSLPPSLPPSIPPSLPLSLSLYSAGVGRTGTVIAIDIALEQAAQMRAVDVPSVVYNMRRQRMKMIQACVSKHLMLLLRGQSKKVAPLITQQTFWLFSLLVLGWTNQSALNMPTTGVKQSVILYL